jgi:hypothetical protein
MIKQTKFVLFLSFLTTILMGLQCGKDKDYIAPPKQRFLETVSLSPAQKIYNINDTIWLRYVTSNKTFLDTISGKRLPTNMIKFKFGATLLPKYGTPTNPSDGFCNFILPANTTAQYVTNQSGTATYFNIDCDGSSTYDIAVGVVLKYQGIYVLNLPDGITLQACANQTNPYPNATLQFIYNLADCNKDVYLSIPASSRQEFPVGFTEAQIDYKVAYAFEVQ